MIKTLVKRLLVLVLLASAAAPPLLAQTTETYTFNPNKAVPDGNASGLVDVRTVPSAIGNITGLKVKLKVTGEFNGDLYGYVKHSSGYTVLLNRPGKTVVNTNGYADSGLDITFQNGAVNTGGVGIEIEVMLATNVGTLMSGIWAGTSSVGSPVCAGAVTWPNALVGIGGRSMTKSKLVLRFGA